MATFARANPAPLERRAGVLQGRQDVHDAEIRARADIPCGCCAGRRRRHRLDRRLGEASPIRHSRCGDAGYPSSAVVKRGRDHGALFVQRGRSRGPGPQPRSILPQYRPQQASCRSRQASAWPGRQYLNAGGATGHESLVAAKGGQATGAGFMISEARCRWSAAPEGGRSGRDRRSGLRRRQVQIDPPRNGPGAVALYVRLRLAWSSGHPAPLRRRGRAISRAASGGA